MRKGKVIEQAEPKEKWEKFAPDVHRGNTIHYLSQIYGGDPMSVIGDLVQNSIDEHPKRINIEISPSRRVMTVYDDGGGVGYHRIREKYQRIASSFKAGDPETIGEKGIGLLTPLSIGQKYSLISRDRDVKNFFEVLVEKESATKDEPEIKQRWLGKDFSLAHRFVTRLTVCDIDKRAIKRIADVSKICEYIASRFPSLRRSQVVITVAVVNEEGFKTQQIVRLRSFPGERHVWTFETKFGTITVELYVTHDPVKSPEVMVEHSSVFCFPLHESGLELDPEAEKVLFSGHFQGYLKQSFCELTPRRDSLVTGKESSLFSETIEEFVIEVLKPLVKAMQDAHKNQKYGELFLRIASSFKNYFNQHRDLMPEALKAIVTTRHKDVVENEEPGNFRSQLQNIREQMIKEVVEKPPDKSKDRIHVGAHNPKGTPRAPKDEPGISIRQAQEIERPRSWLEGGTIFINTIHIDFTRSEGKSQAALDRYVTELVAWEIAVVSAPSFHQAILRNLKDRTFFELWSATI